VVTRTSPFGGGLDGVGDSGLKECQRSCPAGSFPIYHCRLVLFIASSCHRVSFLALACSLRSTAPTCPSRRATCTAMHLYSIYLFNCNGDLKGDSSPLLICPSRRAICAAVYLYNVYLCNYNRSLMVISAPLPTCPSTLWNQ
jgi:hypothetical protein